MSQVLALQDALMLLQKLTGFTKKMCIKPVRLILSLLDWLKKRFFFTSKVTFFSKNTIS